MSTLTSNELREKPPRQKNKSQLIQALDKAFNRFIRERDSHGDGTFTCIWAGPFFELTK